MDEQIEQIARAMKDSASVSSFALGRVHHWLQPHDWETLATAAHSVIAGTIAEHRAAAEMLFKRLEHLRDMSGTENRLERGNHAAFNTALEIARATLAALAPPRHD